MIRVLIVDDSRVVQEFLSYIFRSDPEFSIAGIAGSGEEAIVKTAELKPDIITMDINMPGISGIEATTRIMETTATPIVIVSGAEGVTESSSVFRLLEAGALAVVQRPPDMRHPGFKEVCSDMLKTVRLMSEIKVVSLVKRSQTLPTHPPKQSKDEILQKPGIQLIALGASTGGPNTIQKILSSIPKNINVPVVIVQHITKGFIHGMLEWLSATSAIPLRVASQGEMLLKGTAYFAPDDFHLGVSNKMTAILDLRPPENGIRPSVDYLFRSVSKSFGAGVAGILLTGMGKDGAVALKILKDQGAITIVQDEESSTVFGMPGEAVKLGAATYILPPGEIAALIGNLTSQSGL